MAPKGMTDEQVMSLAKKVVEDALRESQATAKVGQPYHDKDLYRIPVTGPDGKEAHLVLYSSELTEDLEKARQKARLFVADVLRKGKSTPAPFGRPGGQPSTPQPPFGRPGGQPSSPQPTPGKPGGQPYNPRGRN